VHHELEPELSHPNRLGKITGTHPLITPKGCPGGTVNSVKELGDGCYDLIRRLDGMTQNGNGPGRAGKR
jgi:hypothetical protein